MLAAFADTCQSYVYTYCIKTALKEIWKKKEEKIS